MSNSQPPHGPSSSRGNTRHSNGNSNPRSRVDVYDPPYQPPPRRSSYASVVAGAPSSASSTTVHFRNPQIATPSSSFPPPSSTTIYPRSVDSDTQPSWGPRMSTSAGLFGPMSSMQDASTPRKQEAPFFIPSYLQGTRYAHMLTEQHKSRTSALRDGKPAHFSTSASLSTSSSSLNLASHFDVSSSNDPPNPLPSRWNENDKNSGLEVMGDGRDLKLAHHNVRRTSDEACSVRTDHPIPRECGLYYYEIAIHNRSPGNSGPKETVMGIGFAGQNTTLTRLPGWEANSWAYHGDDGQIYAARDTGKPYREKFGPGDTVGCGINFRTGIAFFTRNGAYLGPAFRDSGIRTTKIYPIIGMKKPNEHITANFGQDPFVFDIIDHMQNEKRIILNEISVTDTTNLEPPLSENELIHSLISQYLAHDGYSDTARAFAREIHSDKAALTRFAGSDDPAPPTPDIPEDHDAVTRQRIRAAIHSGDIDTAISLTQSAYPAVLHSDSTIYFRLRARKFAEMILLRTSDSRRRSKRPARASADEGVFPLQMELDDAGAGASNGWDSMEEAVTDADLIAYGQELQREFGGDTRKDVKKMFEDTMALMVYANPRKSALSDLLEESGRSRLAEELNSAILLSQGKPSYTALERIVQQTEVLLAELGDDGGYGAFIHLTSDILHPSDE